MLITTFGPPSGFTQFCLHLMRFMTDEVLRDVDYVGVGELSQLRDAWATRRHPHMLFFNDCPQRELVDVFLKLQAPSIIFVEEVDDITGYIIRERGMQWTWALRLAHQCIAAIGDLLVDGNSLVLRREYELTFREFFQAVANHFELTMSVHQMDIIMTKAGMSGEFDLNTPVETALLSRWSHARPMKHGLEGVPRSEIKVMGMVNAPLRSILAGKSAETFAWPQEMFICGDRPNDILLDTIEMVGPARCLCYGPFLHLPMGAWDVALELEVKDNLSGNRFDVDVYHGEVIALESFRIPAAGRFMIRARFEIRDPREAVQIRIIMREGAIEGSLDVRSATVQAVQMPTLSRTSG